MEAVIVTKVWLLFSAISAHGAAVPTSIVETRAGKIVGSVEDGVHAFRGIPFAAPPINELRWKPPQPVVPWSGVLNTSVFGNRCIDNHGVGFEDCLFLNVWAPPLAGEAVLPVLVWVHGGAYESLSSDNFDATQSAKFHMQSGQPVVIVSMNYRLNVFGFLGSEFLRSRDTKDGSTGNYGIQDQRASFLWVQENIRAFGGDPHRVMIFGESAGAGSISNHLVMHRSGGLFSSAVMESGSFGAWVAHPLSKGEAIYEQMLALTGCRLSNCLASLPAANLSAAVRRIPGGGERLPGDPFMSWSPTIDGVELTAHPWLLLRGGNLNKVPVIHGTNLDEGAMFPPVAQNATSTEFSSKCLDWYSAVLGERNASLIADMYLNMEIHPEVESVTNAWWAGERLFTDQSMACPTLDASRQLSAHGVDVFQYLFTRADPHLPVVTHTAEINYVFANFQWIHKQEDRELSAEMASYWYRHAAFGNPNGNLNTTSETWPLYQQPDAQYLQFDVASAGGIRTVPSSFLRNRTCPLMHEWLQRVMYNLNLSMIADVKPASMDVIV